MIYINELTSQKKPLILPEDASHSWPAVPSRVFVALPRLSGAPVPFFGAPSQYTKLLQPHRRPLQRRSEAPLAMQSVLWPPDCKICNKGSGRCRIMSNHVESADATGCHRSFEGT